MEIFGKKFNRKDYLSNQINRSEDKFEYCKVRYVDVLNWYHLIKKINNLKINNICCMGSRNGREIDLFRIIFNNYLISKITKLTEIRRDGWNNFLNLTLSYKRSNLMINHKGINVFGVEINPRAKRQDTFIGSFDELPQNWEKKFEIIYSNSFDQSMKPEETANEWKRILKPGGYIVFSFSYNKIPTESDPVGGIKLEDVKNLFGGEIVYYDKYGSNYSDIILKI